MYLGLSILIASISYLCYKHPPTTWLFSTWLQRPLIQDAPSTKGSDAPVASVKQQGQEEKRVIPSIVEDTIIEKITEPVAPGPPAKVANDRKMMPPPPPPTFKKPSSPTTPRASATTAAGIIPSFNLSHDDDLPRKPTSQPRDQPPLFPAANSAQRAGNRSTTTSANTSQPRLAAFPALNSAQRASGGSNAPPRLPAVGGGGGGGLMAPPSVPRSSLPNRGPPTSQASSSLFPPPTHSAIPTKPSKKVQLTPNHSPLDWARLTSTSQSLNGLPPNSPYLRVPPSLLKQMTGRKGKDAWMVLGGKVYNVTPYADFHPGGVPELMKGAGRDGTRLFGEVHPWVNWEGMLEGCLVGIAVDEGERRGEGGLEDMD